MGDPVPRERGRLGPLRGRRAKGRTPAPEAAGAARQIPERRRRLPGLPDLRLGVTPDDVESSQADLRVVPGASARIGAQKRRGVRDVPGAAGQGGAEPDVPVEISKSRAQAEKEAARGARSQKGVGDSLT